MGDGDTDTIEQEVNTERYRQKVDLRDTEEWPQRCRQEASKEIRQERTQTSHRQETTQWRGTRKTQMDTDRIEN